MNRCVAVKDNAYEVSEERKESDSPTVIGNTWVWLADPKNLSSQGIAAPGQKEIKSSY